MIPALIHRRRGSKSSDPVTEEPCALESSKLQLLSAMDIFQDLPEEEVERLMAATPMKTAERGAVFYGSQDGPEVLFMLKSGRVELYRESSDGKKLTLAVVEQGAFFGEMSLVGQRLVGTSAMALEDSVICRLSREDVQTLMVEHPTVAIRVIEVMAGRLQEARDALQEMAFNDVTGRVAGLLLRLAGEDINIVEGYSHQDLASMVGCLRESLTVVLDRLKGSGALSIGRKKIEITDRAQLERVVSLRSGGRGS